MLYSYYVIQPLNKMKNFKWRIEFHNLPKKPGQTNTEADCLSRNAVFEISQFDNKKKILWVMNVLQLDETKESEKQIKITKTEKLKTKTKSSLMKKKAIC